MNFISSTVDAGRLIKFTVKNTNIRNPISTVKAGRITIKTGSPKITIDEGYSKEWFAQPSPLSSVSVQPNTLQTDMPNVQYLFTITAPGPIL